ncbi:protein yellow-like [Anthonomus grandis grandis]|uniref:protein yellow-like n=1 Tax=Anthonomus grandis grandis TaxID=2921223 RepID=UPI00216599BF|nr:protein yellow-like [Anthonomus grandis grandis]
MSMKILKKLLVIWTLSFATSECSKLQKYFEWNILDFEYPTKLNDMARGRIKLENALPVGIEFWHDKMFITVPRWKEGIPSTLNYVPILSPLKNPPLMPYPDLASNELGNCERGLSTVYRIHVDQCDRLWVLDTGTFGIGNTTQNPCPYAINIYDLKTDSRIHRYEFRKEDTNSRTFIANIAVDLGKSCDDAHAYFSDELGYGLIVYSLRENKSWRFEHSFFMPDPLKGDFYNDNLNFQWGEEGIFGMSLTPEGKTGFRILHFSPLASHREFAVSTEILKNSSKTEDSYHDFYYLDERGPNTHTTARVMTNEGIQFFNLIDQNAIGCWNSKKPYGQQNIAVADKNDELIFPADVKVDKNNYLWVIQDRMPKFLISSLDYSEPNFRVFFAPVDVLIKNTVCEESKPVPQDINALYYVNGGFSNPLYKNVYTDRSLKEGEYVWQNNGEQYFLNDYLNSNKRYSI